MLFSWPQPQRCPKNHGSAAMPGEEEGCVSKWTGHLGNAKIRALFQLSTCGQGRPQPKHPPACQPSGEQDGVGRDASREHHAMAAWLQHKQNSQPDQQHREAGRSALLPQPLALRSTTAVHPAPAGPAKQPVASVQKATLASTHEPQRLCLASHCS